MGAPMTLNLGRVHAIFHSAEKDGRDFLLEHEVYSLLRLAGIAVPRFVFIPAGMKVTRRAVASLGSDEVVVKVVSPLIIHKTVAGGVEFSKASAALVNGVLSRML